jgi:nucleoside-diphosphate-sugar epimerase
MASPLVILGCGFVGIEVARRALAEGRTVVGTTRSEPASADIAWQRAPALTYELTRTLVTPGASVLVAFPPDGRTDIEIAPALEGARIVYISTTGVYGDARGRVDESTNVDGSEPKAFARLAAERAYLDRGATVLRAAGIYGPGRGLHRRLLKGDFRIPGSGTNVVSRIHVADLARLAVALLGPAGDAHRGTAFVVADDAPVPQINVICWLCDRLRLPLPPWAPIDQVATTLRHDRSVVNARIKRALSMSLEYPTYREGFEACLAAEGFSRSDEAARRD